MGYGRGLDLRNSRPPLPHPPPPSTAAAATGLLPPLVQAIVAELTKLGASVEEGHDYCIITPPPPGALRSGVSIETYDDHRMAMAFSLVAACGVPVTILDPGCTRKTFPTYFDVLSTVAKH